MYAYSVYGRPYVGVYENLAECKKDAVKEMEEQNGTFAIGCLKESRISDYVNAEDILERINDSSLQDDVYSFFDDISISYKEYEELSKSIGCIIEKFVRRKGGNVRGYNVERVNVVYFEKRIDGVKFRNVVADFLLE